MWNSSTFIQGRKGESRGPNDNLFALFLESMNEQHDLELHLSHYNCEHLISLIKERPRDTTEHPLPFTVEDNTLEDNEMGNHSESTVSVAASVSSLFVNNTPPAITRPVSQPLKQALSNNWRKLSVGSTSRAEKTEDSMHFDDFKDSLRQTDVENLPRLVPRWRCFVKHVDSNHIILCFIPASYDDLRLLVQGQVLCRMGDIMGDDEADKEEIVEHINIDGLDSSELVRQYVDGVEHVLKLHAVAKPDVATPSPLKPTSSRDCTDAASDVNQSDTPKKSELEITKDMCRDSDDTMFTSTPYQSPLKPGSEHYVIETDEISGADTQGETVDEVTVHPDIGNAGNRYRSFNIPVYIYNCPLTSLTEQLVNKWTYVKPPDLYQDMNIIREEQGEVSRASSKEDLTAEGSAVEPDVADGTRRRQRQDSETFRERLCNIREELNSESSSTEQDFLKQHFTLVTEYYLRSFVVGQCYF